MNIDRTNAVVSFEELVGSHGGLGGWQAEPFVAYPRTCPCSTDSRLALPQ